MTDERKILLVVEGQHDQAFIAAILRSRHGFSPRTRLSQIDRYWEKTIPRIFPHDDDLHRRMPVPSFYARPGASLAIIVSIGDSRLVHVVQDTLDILEPMIDAVGVVLDADASMAANERFAVVQSALSAIGLAPGARPGAVGSGSPSCGVYVLPDNASNGTLETILIECAEKNYPAALSGARAFIGSVDPRDYQPDDLHELNKAAGRNKATVAAITAILKPGKTTQASISDNRWLHGEAAQLKRVVSFERFLEELVNGPGGHLASTTPASTDAAL